MGDLVTSIIRTVVPMIVGSLVSFLATKGINLDEQSAAALGTFLAALFSAIYYVIARVLEEKFPQLGILLGVKRPPQY